MECWCGSHVLMKRVAVCFDEACCQELKREEIINMNSKQENGDHYDGTVSEYTGSDCSDVEEDTSGECFY